MNETKLQKNFDTWCRRNLPTNINSESKKYLWNMYVYFSNRLKEKDNKITKLEANIPYNSENGMVGYYEYKERIK